MDCALDPFLFFKGIPRCKLGISHFPQTECTEIDHNIEKNTVHSKKGGSSRKVRERI